MTTVDFTETYKLLSCGECGIRFALPEGYIEMLKKSHEVWYCPKGHERYYPDESDQEKYERLYNQELECCTRLTSEVESQSRSIRAYKGRITRLKPKSTTGNGEEEV